MDQPPADLADGGAYQPLDEGEEVVTPGGVKVVHQGTAASKISRIAWARFADEPAPEKP